MNKYLLLLYFFAFSSLRLHAQINAYARVVSISGTTLTLANVNETYHTFNVGEKAIIMQMQDDVIGTNTADNASFGDCAAIGSAGLYEVVTITNKSLPNLEVSVLSNTYNTCANCRVQIVSFRRLGNPNYTTTANITALNWDGNIGGIIAMEVPGTLTLNHNISADGAGFRGGNRSNNYYDGSYGCYPTPYRVNSTNHAFKGEGIYRNTSATYNNARAKIINGGGGGNHINAGGGGGGNFTAGGRGGPGWNGTAPGCPVATGGYGYGGIALSPYISVNRLFMGGGGGGGQMNNTAGTNGGNGGGIIFLKANTLVTTGVCASRSITANGLNAANSGIDGSGGAGAGGSIVLQVENFSLLASCPLIVSANGGNGGTVVASTHGAGGAGGQGAIMASAASQPANSTFQTLNGNPGCNNSSNPCNSFAGSASGSNNQGIFFLGYGTPLPVHSWNFQAEYITDLNNIILSWQNDDMNFQGTFQILKSYDGLSWSVLQDNIFTNSQNAIATYEKIDDQVAPINYYQLVFKDWNGNITQSEVKIVKIPSQLKIFPNPFQQEIHIEENLDYNHIAVYNQLGQMIYNCSIEPSHTIFTEEWHSGFYWIKLYHTNGNYITFKFFKN